ncbi:ATP-binding protein [Aestuariirhabdus litorea]|uniref:histidine kinase n=1 Tax=Aestuariirhabdus litorea TaxID=2528527 RepID=A0A3P3VNF2_9GAMM|nr:ATP-binding protein [Aestuariirhabdus litorea]RRJ84235.1 hybrid sensor histidine kinase/response regulator [Aestuariirhabdus litorea]RWW97457.1 response regulator [Endozoicomonadaceae bacterium GTF-13]
MKIKAKIVIIVCAVILAAFITTALLVGLKSSNTARTQAYEIAEQTALGNSRVVQAVLQNGLYKAHMLRAAMVQIIESGHLDRQLANHMLISAFEDDLNITSVWSIWEPDAFDGRDLEYINTPAHDATGRFIPAWQLRTNLIVRMPTDHLVNSDLYQRMKRNHRAVIFEPDRHTDYADGRLLVSLVVPIMEYDRFLGVVGIDLDSSVLQAQVVRARVNDLGYAGLVSDKGTLFAHSESSLVGESLAEDPQYRQARSSLLENRSYSEVVYSTELQQEILKIYTPIRVGAASEQWTFVVGVPLDAVLESSRSLSHFTGVIGVATLILMILILSLLLQPVIDPITEMASLLRDLAKGKIRRPRPREEGGDEVDDMFQSYHQLIAANEEMSRVCEAIAVGDFSQRMSERSDGDLVAQIINDMASRRQLIDMEMRSARQAAEQANRAKSQFLSNMSHELRTPLNGVLGYVQVLLRDQSANPGQRQALRGIENCGQHLLSLINDVLDISKIESGRLELEMGSTRLADLLNSVSDIIRQRCQGKGLEFMMEVAPDLPLTIATDEVKLRQILINLLGNAIKFTERGHVLLRVRECPEQQMLEFSVEDSGVGIPADKLKAIFEPFKQADTGHQSSGTGLGLAISRRLCELMGGRLRVRSQEGRGSCFSFTVPLRELDDQSGLQLVDERLQAPHLKAGQRVRVLIADDQETNRDILSRLLGEAGFETLQVHNGQQVLDHLESDPLPLVLMDIRMPVMSGTEAARRIRDSKRYPNTRVIAVSASVFPEFVDHLADYGFDDFIAKPFRASELFSKIQKHLGVEYEPLSLPDVEEEVQVPLPVLPPACFNRLQQAVELGDIEALRQLELELAGMGDAERHFAEKLGALLVDFDLGAIQELLTTLEPSNP